MALRKSSRREPLTWWAFYDNCLPTPHRIAVRAVCSQRHPSTIMHIIKQDGSLIAPAGCAGSMHCGVCNESLPLMLDGWTDDGSPERCPVPPPAAAKCACCRRESTSVSGWGTWSGPGLICPDCRVPKDVA